MVGTVFSYPYITHGNIHTRVNSWQYNHACICRISCAIAESVFCQYTVRLCVPVGHTAAAKTI